MQKSIKPIAGIAALTLVAAFGPMSGAGASQQASPPTQAGCQSFAQTGKQVCGKFLTYWNTHGGLTQQGLPLSGEFKETSSVDGKVYTVQYFERAVFEAHPEKAAPYDVLLSLLGTMRLKEMYPGGEPAPLTLNPPKGVLFPETGKMVDEPFYGYWKSHGGLAQQGYPITNMFPEKSQLNGQTYQVQYFERAVFELHPENPAPFNVLLSQLGRFEFQKKYPNGEPKPTGGNAPLTAGIWGGQHAVLRVTDTGATIEFDCAHGTITQPLVVSADGQIDVAGQFVQEHGGPSVPDDSVDAQPARYTGTTDGKTINLTVILTKQNQVLSTYTLTFGAPGKLVKCL
ncbi:MAG: hypothetical protein M3014_09600 [Chloroflexota bacterium]|nr:hypothetical protein [Chloroflexota bacterium]